MESNTMNQENIAPQIQPIGQDLPTNSAPPVSPKTTIGFWEFIVLIALFAIPVIGFISCVVFLFASKRKTLRNYAGAMLTWIIVRILTIIISVSILFSAIEGLVLPTLNKQLGTEFQKVTEILNLADGIITKDYSKLIKTFSPQLLKAFGEEHAPLLEELSKEEYNDLIQQIIDKKYDAILNDIKNGVYPNLEKSLNENDFNSFISELESASKGKNSILFDSIHQTISPFI